MSARARALDDPQPLAAPPPAALPAAPPPVYPIALYEESISLRIRQLATREQQLKEAGRPENYRMKMGFSIAALCVGATTLTLLYPLAFMSDSSDPHDTRVAYTTVMVTGLAALAGGVAGIIVLRHRGAYRDEIKALRAERKYWKVELNRVRAQQLSWLPEPASVELTFGPRQLALRARF
jgi:hypothetical protein